MPVRSDFSAGDGCYENTSTGRHTSRSTRPHRAVGGDDESDTWKKVLLFIEESMSPNSNPSHVARLGLELIKKLPTIREAAFVYFNTIFDSAVAKYIKQIETEIDGSPVQLLTREEEETIGEIQDTLYGFVNLRPCSWAPIISTWSLNLLGELSSKYAGEPRVSITAGLNETLQLWMNCIATKTLIDITTRCLNVDSDTEACISALLDTSVAHSPYFDWVVAHVGSCFPHTVITRVLSCGLKDFSQHCAAVSAHQSSSSSSSVAAEGANGTSPKLNSVVGILGHLASSHFMDIHKALQELFLRSLNPTVESAQREATVPFLLQLASMSPTLLKALTTNVLHTLTPEILRQLAELAPRWSSNYGGGQSLKDLTVHLCLRLELGGSELIRLLVNTVSPIGDQSSLVTVPMQTIAREILELLLQEIDEMLRSVHNHGPSVPLLDNMKKEIAKLQPFLMSQDLLRLHTACRLIGMLGYYSPAVLISSAAFLLLHATDDDQLAALVRLLSSSMACNSYFNQSPFEKTDIFTQALENAVQSNLSQVQCVNRDEPMDLSAEDAVVPEQLWKNVLPSEPVVVPEQLWRNVAALLRWERSGLVPVLTSRPIGRAALANLRSMSSLLFAPPPLAHAVAHALDLVPLGQLSVHLTHRLTHATVNYFFLCVAETDVTSKIFGAHICCRLLSRLSQYKSAARNFALTELLKSALFGGEAFFFGAAEKKLAPKPTEVRLLNEIQKQGTNSLLPYRHSSMFLAGASDLARYRTELKSHLAAKTVAQNTQLLFDVMTACSVEKPPAEGEEGSVVGPISQDSGAHISLTMVQLISPDVMYNGLPWPDEEFCKVTVERDLRIRRSFDELPLAWQVLRFLASHRPSLCYCSVLLRALTATLLAQWGSAGQHRHSQLLETTQSLLEVMALGQLLPPPLSSLRDVIPALKPQEIVQLLRDCVWNLMRDNVPSPALFAKDSTGQMWRDFSLGSNQPPRQYTDTLRIIMRNNIQQLGVLYSQLFVFANRDNNH